MTEGLTSRLTEYLRQASLKDVLLALRLVAEEVERRGKRHYTMADIDRM